MVNHVNYMTQGMIVLQEKFIGSDNESLKQSICINQLIQENVSTKHLHLLLYLLKDVHAIVKQSPAIYSIYNSLLKSASQFMEEIYIFSTPGNPLLTHKEVVSYVVSEPLTTKTCSLTESTINVADNANMSTKLTITQEEVSVASSTSSTKYIT